MVRERWRLDILFLARDSLDLHGIGALIGATEAASLVWLYRLAAFRANVQGNSLESLMGAILSDRAMGLSLFRISHKNDVNLSIL